MAPDEGAVRGPMPDTVYETLVHALDCFEEFLDSEDAERQYGREGVEFLKRRACEAARWLG